jgi:WD40 repeat protein
VAFSPDRKTLASGGQDNTVRLWEIATGKEIQCFTAVTGPGAEHAWVQSIAFSPDGNFLAAGTGNASSELVMWERATGKQVRRFQGLRQPLASIAFAPDGKTLAASEVHGLIRLWNVADGELRRELKGHEGWVESIAFSPRGETLASASRDKTIRLWDPATGRELRQLQGHGDLVLAVAFARDGKTLASGSWDNTIRLWDPASGKELHVLKGHGGPVSTVVFLADGKTLASGSWDRSIRLWDLTTGEELRQLQGHRGPIPSIALSPDGDTLASASWDRTVRLWDLAKGRERQPTEGHHHALWSVAISPDGKQIASGDENGEVRLWDSATSKELRLFQGRPPGGSLGLVDRLEFSVDGKTLRAASWGYKSCRWETATGKPLEKHTYKGIGLLATPDGKLVASNDGLGTIFVQEAATGKVVREFQTQKQMIATALSADGRFLAAGSAQQDGSVVLWELATGEERCRCKGAYDQLTRLAFSPDGKYLAGTSTRRGFFTPQSPVHLWDAATGREVRQFQGHPNITCLIFSPDGRTLASGGQKTVHLWETATGKERCVWKGHQGYIRSLAFSSDGTRLVSASDDTTALVWDATGVAVGEQLAGRLQTLWMDLAGDDAAKAYRAVWLLARHPAQSVPLLREHVPAARAMDAETRQRVERWLAELDSDEVTVRNRAGIELENMGGAVESLLRKALTGRPSLEQRKRIERLLERLEGEKVTLGRALEALEHTAASEARQLLEVLAAGEAEAWLTREAKATRHRLQATQRRQ